MHRMLAQNVRRFGKSLRSSIAISSCFPDGTASAPASIAAPWGSASGGSADIPKGNRQQWPTELRGALGGGKLSSARSQPYKTATRGHLPFWDILRGSQLPTLFPTPVVTATARPQPQLHFELDAQLSDTFCNNSLTSGCLRAQAVRTSLQHFSRTIC